MRGLLQCVARCLVMKGFTGVWTACRTVCIWMILLRLFTRQPDGFCTILKCVVCEKLRKDERLQPCRQLGDSKGLYSHGCLKKSSESPERTRHPACMFLSRLCSSVPLKLNSAPGMPLLSLWLTAPGQTAAPGVTADDGSAGDDAFVWDSAFCDGTCLLCFLSWHTSVW